MLLILQNKVANTKDNNQVLSICSFSQLFRIGFLLIVLATMSIQVVVLNTMAYFDGKYRNQSFLDVFTNNYYINVGIVCNGLTTLM